MLRTKYVDVIVLLRCAVVSTGQQNWELSFAQLWKNSTSTFVVTTCLLAHALFSIPIPSPLRQTIKLKLYPNQSCSNRVYSLSFKHAVILSLSLSVRCRSGHSCINTACLVNKTCFILFLHSVPQFLCPSAPHFLGPCAPLPHGPSAHLSLYLFVSSHIRSSVHTRVFIQERESVIQILSYLHIYIHMYIYIHTYIYVDIHTFLWGNTWGGVLIG